MKAGALAVAVPAALLVALTGSSWWRVAGAATAGTAAGAVIAWLAPGLWEGVARNARHRRAP